MPKKKPAQKSKSPSRKKRNARQAETGEQRINKVLASAGLGSRREVEELILQGRVEVDREIVTQLSTKVDPAKAKIKVDGVPLKRSRHVYFALNKPSGVLSTNSDPSGRMRVIDLVPDNSRVFSVGRLDKSSEGLMLLTNDGTLAQRLAHPKFRVQKTYFVVVAGVLTKEELDALRKGVYLAEGVARIDGAKIKKQRKGSTELEIVLSEGKNREIRRILARAGHKVVLLRRIAIGSLKLGTLPIGASRELTSAEVKALYASTERRNQPRKARRATKKKQATELESLADDEWDPIPLDLVVDDSFDDEVDDDFVGGYSSTSAGSIIGGDESDSGFRATKDRSRKRTSSRGPARQAKPDSRETTKKTRRKKSATRGSSSRPSRGSNKANPKASVARRGKTKAAGKKRAPTPRKGRTTRR